MTVSSLSEAMTCLFAPADRFFSFVLWVTLCFGVRKLFSENYKILSSTS